MSSEKQLREIAATTIREHLQDEPLNAIFEDVCCEQSLNPEHPDAERIRDLIHDWPILDLPVPDRHGYLWPEHGRNYGNVHISPADPSEIVISRGGPGEAFRRTNMTLTRDEALELASLLTAATLEEAGTSHQTKQDHYFVTNRKTIFRGRLTFISLIAQPLLSAPTHPVTTLWKFF